MKYISRRFLNPRSFADDFISACIDTGDSYATIKLSIYLDGTKISLHSESLPAFIEKLKLLATSIESMLGHTMGTLCNHRTWLNPDIGTERAYTGYFNWGDDGTTFYIAIADCHRAIHTRISYGEKYSGSTLRWHNRRMAKVLKFVKETITKLESS